MKYTRICLFCCVLWKEIFTIHSTISLEKPGKTDYFNGLVNYLKYEFKVFQVVFILEDELDNIDPMMNSLIKEINQHFPLFITNYDRVFNWWQRIYKKNFDGEMSFRKTTLFVFQTNNDITMKLSIDKLNTINYHVQSDKSRCLIMNSFNSSHQYLNRILHYFWEIKFLDITIMTYDQNHQLTPFLSHINPFIKTFTAQEITSKIQWFPNKIDDLKGQKMDFHFISLCDENYLQKNRWMEERITQIFAKVMKCELALKKSYDYGPQLIFNLRTANINNDYSQILRIQKIDAIKAIIPRKTKITKKFVFSPELLYMILGTIVMIGIILLTAFFMKFNRETWQTLNISQIFIGMPANNEPNNWLERIVFGSLLMTCTVYTGYIYSVILDIGLQSEPEISTLEELAHSSLIPQMNVATLHQIKETNFPSYMKKLLDKSEYMDYYKPLWGKNCLEYLAKYKNISCILPNAESHINAYSLSNEDKLDVKILPEIVAYHFVFWTTLENPPFTDFSSKIIQRAIEFGLFEEVYSINNVLPEKNSSPEQIKKEKLFFIIFYVLGIGFSISIISFLFELLTRNFRRSNRVYTLYRAQNKIIHILSKKF